MIELRFHQDLYDGFAIDEAAKVYGNYGSMDLTREADAYVVRVTAGADVVAQGISERTLAAELANYALGMTIEKARDSELGLRSAEPSSAPNPAAEAAK